MKPTNEERREAAARLRGSIYKHTCIYPMCILHDVLVGGKCGPFKTDVEDCRNDCAEEVLNRLADLIEPEPERTCRPLPPLNANDRYTLTAKYASGLEYSETIAYVRCSECSTHFCADYAYCPNCGAKVVGER